MERRGRHSVVGPNTEKKIIETVDKNSNLTSIKICKDDTLNPNSVSVSTIQRLLNNNGYKARVKITVPGISNENKLKRVKWAKKYVSKPPKFWRKVFFSDESKVFAQ